MTGIEISAAGVDYRDFSGFGPAFELQPAVWAGVLSKDERARAARAQVGSMLRILPQAVCLLQQAIDNRHS